MPSGKVIAVTALIAVVAVMVANNVSFVRKFVTPDTPMF